MNIIPIRNSIVARLEDVFATAGTPFLARLLPDTSKQYEMGLVNPTAFVVYSGSQAMPSNSTNVVIQQRQLHFNVEIHARMLYTPNGLDVCRDIVEQALIGWKPTNCQRMYLLKDDIGQIEETQIWVHVLQFECVSMLVQKEETEPIIVPSLQEIIYKEP